MYAKRMSLMMKIVRSMVKRNTSGFFDNDAIDVTAVRAKLGEMLTKNEKRNRPEAGVEITIGEIDGIDVSWSTPEGWDGIHIVYYVHGGGLITGDHTFSLPYASQLAKWTGCQVVCVNYRLAPEHPFPAGLDDSLQVYRRLIEEHNVALIGESGGAYLCFAMALALKDEDTPLPSAVIVNSIVADFSGQHLPRTDVDTEITVSVAGLAALGRMYGVDKDPHNPLVNVILGDYVGFPPVRVIYDDGELLKPDSLAVIEKLRTAKVPVDVGIYEGTFHAFTTTGKVVKESRDELDKTAAFIRSGFGIS